MNDLFRLKNKLRRESFSNGFSSIALHGKEDLKVEHIRNILISLSEVADFYRENTLLDGALVAIKYVGVVPKSRRVQAFFKVYRGKEPDSFIVGARIDGSASNLQHIITYHVSKDILQQLIENASKILESFSRVESISKDAVSAIANRGSAFYQNTGLNSRYVAKFLVDCSNVQEVTIPQAKLEGDGPKLITIFQVGYKIGDLLKKLHIGSKFAEVWNDYSAVLDEEHVKLLKSEAGYFIAMAAIHDREQLKVDMASMAPSPERAIPLPTNEPVIGVIDTFYDDHVYYHPWVLCDDQYIEMKPTKIEDKVHATEVCSILVDGPALNPSLDDHCGRFQVRLFPVALAGKNSWINIANSIEKIVSNNPEIHVWNLSLGSDFEVDENYISPMGSILDELQVKYPNILFVVAGTNIPQGKTGSKMRVGSPADSINSLVVNSVNFQGEPAIYSRMGPVLSFFRKPDISYYGGEPDAGINVMTSETCEREACGTSFAAPWIARKACYMMEVMGFSREETKALLIDSALSFEKTEANYKFLGYGVVPIAIEDVVQSKNDEIRFIIKDISEAYYTCTYNLPIPTLDDTFPFKARIVMASTLKCDRNKGVDYTCEELGLSFGRMKKGKIVTINGDKQEESDVCTTEETARSLFRKWDNIKVVNELVQKRRVPVKVLDEDGLWGLRITSKLRNDTHSPQRNTNFAVVVTMKEIYGQNRSNKFESLCISRGWIVERINIEAKLEMYNLASAELEWK